MTICRACSAEIIGPDRYCRSCGAPVAPSVSDLVDTARFNPAVHSAMPDPANPVYANPPANAGTQGLAPLYHTAPVSKRLLQWRFILPVLLLALLLLGAWGAAIGYEKMEERRTEQAEMTRRLFEEAVQNALGFKQGVLSEAEFSDVHGIFINHLMSDDSPAALAKLQGGDVLLELNGQAVRNISELAQVLGTLKTGDEVPVKFYRDGETGETRLKLADRAFPPLQPKIAPRDQGFLGIKEASRRCCQPGTKKWGVEIQELYDNASAELFGLQVGDVIFEFNGLPVRTPNEFNRRIRAVKPRSKVTLKYFRGNTEQTVELILGHRWGGHE
jgi:membrane-associated protease RseP (regulator of RpoE activity)